MKLRSPNTMGSLYNVQKNENVNEIIFKNFMEKL